MEAHHFSWEKLIDLLSYHPEAPMLFSSGLFFFLFFGFLSIYVLLHRCTLARLVYVTLFSLYFYYKSSGLWFVLLLFTASSDYYIARAMQETTDRKSVV